MITALENSHLPYTARLSSAYAGKQVTTREYNSGLRVAALEDKAKKPICEATWGDVIKGDTVLVARYGQIVKVQVNNVERGKDSILIDYVVGDRAYYGVLLTPSQAAYIQSRY